MQPSVWSWVIAFLVPIAVSFLLSVSAFARESERNEEFSVRIEAFQHETFTLRQAARLYPAILRTVSQIGKAYDFNSALQSRKESFVPK